MFGPFGKRFAYQYQGGDWGGWTPPWLQDDEPERHHGHGHHHHHHGYGPHGGHGPEGWQEGPRGGGWRGPRFFEARRRGPFGPGGPFGPEGPRGPFGPGGPGEGPGGHGPFGPGKGHRFFGRGDVKYAVLELLRERPMHGYEVIKALEEKSGGFYTPSAGSIYPTLQLLEDRELVTVKETEGKKVYSITDAGQAFLAEQQKNTGEFAGPPWARGFGGRGGLRGNPEAQALRAEAAEVAQLFAIAARSSFNNPEQLARLRKVIESTRNDLTELIYSTDTGKTETTESPEVDQA